MTTSKPMFYVTRDPKTLWSSRLSISPSVSPENLLGNITIRRLISIICYYVWQVTLLTRRT